MFKHVLIPTDGSLLSKKAVKAGIAFAKEFGTRATLYHAIEVVPPYTYGGFAPPYAMEPIEAAARKQGQKYLDEATKLAQAANVRCESQITKPETIYRGIIDVAKKKGCDVIFMASHGRGGVASLVLGSVTVKVLAHTKIPVVVFR
jgi:nucleotide-binding universal stress UspA family protein